MDEKLQSLLRHLPALRAAGVTYLEVDGVKVIVDRVPQQADGAPAPGPQSPWNDPQTYGMPDGTAMPPSLARRVGSAQ